MRRGLILPLLAALALVACQSGPSDPLPPYDDTAGEEHAALPDGENGAAASQEAPAADADVGSEEMAALDPNRPPPGTQEDLVHNVGDRVFFDLDSAVLLPDARRTLERQAGWLDLYPGLRLVIEGHCDERGTREYNLALGERRANAVREYLITHGIAPSRLRTISYGKERPYALGHDDEAWALNRRAVSIIE